MGIDTSLFRQRILTANKNNNLKFVQKSILFLETPIDVVSYLESSEVNESWCERSTRSVSAKFIWKFTQIG